MMKNNLSYKIKAEVENLEKVILPLMDAIKKTDIEPRIAYKIRLAVDELLTNVVNYAYDGKVGDVEVKFHVDEDPRAVVIQIIDSGKEFNPLNVKEPDLFAEVKDRKIGGLGIYIAKKVMDELTYQRVNEQNIVTLKKFF